METAQQAEAVVTKLLTVEIKKMRIQTYEVAMTQRQCRSALQTLLKSFAPCSKKINCHVAFEAEKESG